MKIRTIATVLVLSLLLTGLATVFTVAGEPQADGKGASGDGVRILSDTVVAFPTTSDDGRPMTTGSATGHGNNQTRIVSTDTGVYITTPLQDETVNYDTTTTIGLWHLNNDGQIDMAKILTDSAKGVAAGTTSNIMADNDGNIWVVCQYIDNSYCDLLTYMYDPKTGELHDYSGHVFVTRGTSYGKAGTIMDAKLGKIYSVVVGGEGSKSGHLLWFSFDIATKTWSKCHYKKVACCAYYHYGFADGKGGFTTICENVRTNADAKTDIEGMSVAKAIETFHSHHQVASYCWETATMVYVPNADEDVGYEWTITPAIYDVENGLYPNDFNSNNDIYFDRETGLAYAICTLLDNGEVGNIKHLYIMDTNKVNENVDEDGPYEIKVHKTIEFMLGYSETYTQHIYKDTEGNYYIIAIASHTGRVEIWKATDNLFSDIRLVWTEDFQGVLTLTSAANSYGLIIATNRNNSVEDDTAELILWVTDKWYYFSVDFAALRNVNS